MSRTMSTLVRSSTAIEPRGESTSCARAWMLVGRGVADRDEPRLERRELQLLAAARDRQLALLLELGSGATRIRLPLRTMPEALGLEHDVERLIPGHVAHPDRDGAGDVVGGDDVDVADVGEQAQDVVDVGVLEIEIDATPRVAVGRREGVAGDAGGFLHLDLLHQPCGVGRPLRLN